MVDSAGNLAGVSTEILGRALDARDARFDGLFFVGIVSTGIYCRPICPARVSHKDRRRFFLSAAAAERAGFRPCLRCRPELAPGRAPVDAMSCLARAAERRIAEGALNGRTVGELARELGVSERHLRRALERELGVSAIELAQTHRLLLAKRLLADTSLPVTQIAFASGFQSLRRFNSAFRTAYRMPPSAVKRPATARRAARTLRRTDPAAAFLGLTVAYRAPLAWNAVLQLLERDAIRGVESVCHGRYARTVSVEGHAGVVVVENAPSGMALRTRDAPGPRAPGPHLRVRVSASLAPALMPLLVRLRTLFDLDAEPTLIDRHLSAEGLGPLVRRHPGLRMPGALCGFDVALRALVRDGASLPSRSGQDPMLAVTRALGTPCVDTCLGLTHLSPSAERIADAGLSGLVALGVADRSARSTAALARLVADGRLRLEPATDPFAARRALVEVTDGDEALVETILMRALGLPDAFPLPNPALEAAAGAGCRAALVERAERWRPWRAYAALHLWLSA